jgi:hypothetical protein
MDLAASFRDREASLIKLLMSKQAAIDDRTGKGATTEIEIERALLQPYMPPGFECGKGSVVSGPPEWQQSGAIDRVIYCQRDCPPLVADEGHSIFPVESVAGVVEITMHLDSGKLRDDMTKTKAVREMRRRNYMTPVPGSRTSVQFVTQNDGIGCRAWVIGLPGSGTWEPKTIARAFESLQTDLTTLVHGLYVIGVGFFVTITSDEPVEKVRCQAYLGDDRMFRFLTAFRASLDRWAGLPPAWAVNLNNYVEDSGQFL